MRVSLRSFFVYKYGFAELEGVLAHETEQLKDIREAEALQAVEVPSILVGYVYVYEVVSSYHFSSVFILREACAALRTCKNQKTGYFPTKCKLFAGRFFFLAQEDQGNSVVRSIHQRKNHSIYVLLRHPTLILKNIAWKVHKVLLNSLQKING